MSDANQFLNALPLPLIAVNNQLEITYINPAAENVFAVSIARMHGKKLDALKGFDDVLIAHCARAIFENTPMRLLEHALQLPSGNRQTTIQFSPVFEPITKQGAHAHNPQPQQWLICFEKFDGVERTAASSWKQEATRTAGVMAAMLAHEVKNPLSGIRGAAQLLRDEVTHEHAPLTELICSEVDRVKDLLAQVEIFAGGVPGDLEPVNIHKVLQYVLSIANTGFAQHVTFEEKYDPSLPDVHSHHDMLVQLFLNLIKNAAEALQENVSPTITIRTSYKSGKHYSVDAKGARNALPIVVSIEDNGSGIPKDMHGRLFEPFISTKEGGRGLGLAIVAKLAADLGAVVELDNEHKFGTRFTIALAMAESKTASVTDSNSQNLTDASAAAKLAS